MQDLVSRWFGWAKARAIPAASGQDVRDDRRAPVPSAPATPTEARREPGAPRHLDSSLDSSTALWVTAHGIDMRTGRARGTETQDDRHRSEGCRCTSVATQAAPGKEDPRRQLRLPDEGKDREAGADAVRPATGAETLDIAVGTIVVDTGTGGMGRVRTVAPNGMISVEHPNGHTWKTCAVRAASSVERLNLLAADAAQARRFPRREGIG
ncbi:hypothetical protein [Streptomyces syringium]|uniref:hypothetical protein n=1 Tax=Streptomyces syringium TaxID=76729 RepID=UPI0033F99926